MGNIKYRNDARNEKKWERTTSFLSTCMWQRKLWHYISKSAAGCSLISVRVFRLRLVVVKELDWEAQTSYRAGSMWKQQGKEKRHQWHCSILVFLYEIKVFHGKWCNIATITRHSGAQIFSHNLMPQCNRNSGLRGSRFFTETDATVQP